VNRTRRLLAVTAVGAFLVVGVAACGSSSGSDSSSDDTAKTTVADSGDSGTSDTTADSGDSGDAGDTEGTGTVTLADGEAPADKTITFTDGAFDPTTLEVAVGELFTVKQGGDGINAVKFGDSTDTYTISGGLIESFTIDAAGTYTMTEDLTGATATITVTE
jgi:hypothetical protein